MESAATRTAAPLREVRRMPPFWQLASAAGAVGRTLPERRDARAVTMLGLSGVAPAGLPLARRYLAAIRGRRRADG
jgi:hypothetical protein